MTNFRRVITGQIDGKAVFVADESVEALTAAAIPGVEMLTAWGADEVPGVPNSGTLPSFSGHFPRPNGLRVLLFCLPPDNLPVDWDPTSDAALEEVARKFPGLLEAFDPEHAGMHTSQTIDIAIVLEGSLVLELDDGATRSVDKGAVIIQNGTKHKWSNPTSERAWVLFVLVGAELANNSK
jgi:hypothetical protein